MLPGLTEDVKAGQTIVYNRHKTLTLNIDGKTSTVETTATNVREILDENGYEDALAHPQNFGADSVPLTGGLVQVTLPRRFASPTAPTHSAPMSPPAPSLTCSRAPANRSPDSTKVKPAPIPRSARACGSSSPDSHRGVDGHREVQRHPVTRRPTLVKDRKVVEDEANRASKVTYRLTIVSSTVTERAKLGSTVVTEPVPATVRIGTRTARRTSRQARSGTSSPSVRPPETGPSTPAMDSTAVSSSTRTRGNAGVAWNTPPRRPGHP